jgi:hypothetical protein
MKPAGKMARRSSLAPKPEPMESPEQRLYSEALETVRVAVQLVDVLHLVHGDLQSGKELPPLQVVGILGAALNLARQVQEHAAPLLEHHSRASQDVAS